MKIKHFLLIFIKVFKYFGFPTCVAILSIVNSPFSNYFKINMDYVIGLSNEMINIDKITIIDKKIVGKNIKNFRINNNITQEKLAKELGTTHSVISAYENGHTLILTAFLINLCFTYNLSADEVCNRNNG